MQSGNKPSGSKHSLWKEAAIEGAIHTAAEWLGGAPLSMATALTRFGTLNEGEDDILLREPREAMRRYQEEESRVGKSPSHK